MFFRENAVFVIFSRTILEIVGEFIYYLKYISSIYFVHFDFVLSINPVILQIVSHFRIILELMVIRVIPLNAGHLVPAHITSP